MSAISEMLAIPHRDGILRPATRSGHATRSGRAWMKGSDFLALLNDLLVAVDVLSVSACGLGSAAFYLDASILHTAPPHAAAGSAAAGGATMAGALLREVLLGAVLGAVLLRDRTLGTPARFRDGGRLLGGVARRAAVLLSVLGGIGFATRSLDDLARGWVVLWSVASLVCVLGSRVTLLGVVRVMQRRGGLRETVALVGHGEGTARLARHLRREGSGVELVGVFDDREGACGQSGAGYSGPGHSGPGHSGPGHSGDVAALLRLGRTRRLDRVIVALCDGEEARLPAVLREVKSLSAEVALCPLIPAGRLAAQGLAGALAGPFDGLPLVPVAGRPLHLWGGIAKALTDRVLAGLALLALSPLMLAVALAIRLDSPGAAIFRQERDGWNGSRFTVLKFRSMRADAPVPGVLCQTVRGDARCTPLGALLRRTSLDELPQLINVLRGDMSLVGPRPHAVSMRTGDRLCHEIVAEYAQRHRVKPGLTGWAQVNGCRGATATAADLQRRVDLDLHYIENWSFLLDLRIMALTVVKLFASEGAF